MTVVAVSVVMAVSQRPYTRPALSNILIRTGSGAALGGPYLIPL